MVSKHGSIGRVEVMEDFLSFTITTAGNDVIPQAGIHTVAVGTGSFATTIDEPGGILSCVTATVDNSNVALYSGPFKAADGGCVIEARFKVADVTTNALFCGFSELLVATGAVCPIEASGSNSLTVGAGSAMGILRDIDQTTDTFLAVASDNSAAETAVNTGLSPTNDEWEIVRVEVDPDGGGRVYMGEDNQGLVLQKEFAAGILTTSVVLHPVLICECRSAVANTLEVDYFYARGYRDWTD